MDAALGQRTRRFHLVSQVVLRQFCDDRHLLIPFSLARRKTGRPIGPDGVCWESRIYPRDVQAFENVWKASEDRLREAFDAIESRTILANGRLMDILRDCLAIHLARSNVLMRVDDLAMRKSRPGIEQWAADDPRLIARYRQEHHGLYPTLQEARRYAARMVDDELSRIEATPDLADRFLAIYAVATKHVNGHPIEIGLAQEGEFLIGDAPAQSYRTGHPGVGPLGGVPWGKASTFMMPLGRRYVMGLGRAPAYLDLDRSMVDRLNAYQVVAAHKQVVWHPDADFRSFVSGALDARPPAEATQQ
jgi:hypothetical protein